MGIKLGNLILRNRIFLAPMLEPNDIAFRLLCKKAGVGLTYTGMIHPSSKQKLFLQDKPGIQIFCVDEKYVNEFMNKNDKKVSLWDFNLGCPSKIARKMGFGVFLHNKLGNIEKILKTIKENTKKPVTIKLRKSEQNTEIIKLAEKYCDAICIHPRTDEQGYSGKADLDYAISIKKLTKLPIIYSGDVSEANISRLLEIFDFVMIGRSCIGDPGIFSRAIGKKSDINFFDYLKLAEKYKIGFGQIKLQAMNFTKKKNNAKEMRRKLILAKNIEEIRKIYSEN